ncbi:thioesterase family protein [Mycolicibacterium vaccae]|uniref:thioesterase family protein n=1 Tax=Mycolicibacterium vaccae TaxID=1810 RepID=UPI00030D634D|nr:thioesterase family protein [Mycolicibacterium vaccae]ANI39091.1 thioesterase [Mycolicibacterium vaccae 95051]MCV7063198.1 thioesterase family protein [Mycolicibacterium vaccae]
MTDAYYDLVDADDVHGERFTASDHVVSTWGADMQNAAPVSALLVRAAERCAPRDDARLSRVVVDLLGPVPAAGDLWVHACLRRPGRQIELIDAEMLAAGPDGTPRPVAIASAWRFQRSETVPLPHSPAEPMRPVCEGRSRTPDDGTDRTYIQSLDWRWLNDILHSEQAECWATPLVDLVAGEEMTPVQRLFTVADIANGMGSRLDTAEFTFLNTDLAVHINRLPVGPWIGVRAENHYGADGVGVSRGMLFDEHGPVAAIQQAQLVRPRR